MIAAHRDVGLRIACFAYMELVAVLWEDVSADWGKESKECGASLSLTVLSAPRREIC